jgi:hypothetical protein
VIVGDRHDAHIERGSEAKALLSELIESRLLSPEAIAHLLRVLDMLHAEMEIGNPSPEDSLSLSSEGRVAD